MMNILIVNQSAIDMVVSFFILIRNVGMKKSGMSRDSTFDQFVCRFWLTRKPLWCMLVTSTYGIVIMTLSRYIAVIYPIRYKTVRNGLPRMWISMDISMDITLAQQYSIKPMQNSSKLQTTY